MALLLRFGSLDAVLRTADTSFFNSIGVQGTSHHVVTHTWQIFHTTTTHQNNAVLLEIVALIRNVSDHLIAIGEAHFGNLTHGRVGLLWSTSHDLDTHTPPKRTILQGWRSGFHLDFLASLSD